MGINVSLIAGSDESQSSVEISGSMQHVITDEEVETFHLNDEQLKQAVAAYFSKRPNDAYLHSPTPWDLYKTYNWEQVQVILVPKKATILGITSAPVIVKDQEFVNNSGKKGTFTVGITHSVNNTTSSNWNTGGKLTIGQKISYGLLVKGETSFSYEQSWGIGGQQSQSFTVGSSSGVTVNLDPGEAVLVQLTASQGVMRVRIDYLAYLIGGNAVNYDPIYGPPGNPDDKHHFWCLPINDVMSAGKIENSMWSTEDIEVGYYSNAKIVLLDKKTKALIAERAMSNLYA
ncbi:MAG: hypothetical protein ACYDC7_11240 [Acidithiobacillus ferrivorans]